MTLFFSTFIGDPRIYFRITINTIFNTFNYYFIDVQTVQFLGFRLFIVALESFLQDPSSLSSFLVQVAQGSPIQFLKSASPSCNLNLVFSGRCF